MEKMCFFMNVDLAWIKQRPHFMAECISKYYHTVVFYPFFFNRSILTKEREEYSFKAKKIFRVPNVVKSVFIHEIIDEVVAFFIKIYLTIYKPDILFFTDPKQVKYIPNNYSGEIVYDCMDDLVALAKHCKEKKRVFNNELLMIKKANLILVSSNELINVINDRYGGDIAERIRLCRNAYNGNVKEIVEDKHNRNGKFRICYFGTISSWFDIELIDKSLKKDETIEYWIAGPITEGVNLPNNERVKYFGVLSHSKIDEFVKNCDCFIMPFLVNDIIKAVDPVKLYEYINFHKNVLSVFYEEIERFEPFVYFYNDFDEYINLLNEIKKDKKLKYTEKDRVEFLNDNTWENRVEYIVGLLKDEQ